MVLNGQLGVERMTYHHTIIIEAESKVSAGIMRPEGQSCRVMNTVRAALWSLRLCRDHCMDKASDLQYSLATITTSIP